tara:strand:- start:870 stop:1124 length:255 start_codon:yes stop_codon:yes gene_type:complete
MENYRGFKVTYKPSSNLKGGYISLTDLRRIESVKVSLFNSSSDDITEIAEEYLKDRGIKCIGRIENGNQGFVLFSDEFTKSIKN